MSSCEKRMWGIHSMNDNMLLQENVMAIGWYEMENLCELENSREAFKEKYSSVYPEAKKGAVATGAGMLYRFCHDINIGDYVVLPSKADKMINIGIVESDYIFNPNAVEYVQQRKVTWLKHLPRSMFTRGALYEVGAALTLFEIKTYADEYLAALNGNGKPFSQIEIDNGLSSAEDIKEFTRRYVLKCLSVNLKGYDLENFVAELLEAMGYKADVSSQGGDSGIDIIAYKDELPPRIVVQVKSQDSNIGEDRLQAFKGAMHSGDYGVFVTLSDYTKNARSFLENNPMIRGINGNELVELILKYYECLNKQYRKLIPLDKVYIPIISDDE